MTKDVKRELIIADVKYVKISASDLRKKLWLELEDLRSGNSSIQRANAVSKLASQILDSIRLEVQYKWTDLSRFPKTQKLIQDVQDVKNKSV